MAGSCGEPAVLQEGEAVVMHGPNPYFARYDITGKTRPYIDSVTQRIYDTMTVKDIRGKELSTETRCPGIRKITEIQKCCRLRS